MRLSALLTSRLLTTLCVIASTRLLPSSAFIPVNPLAVRSRSHTSLQVASVEAPSNTTDVLGKKKWYATRIQEDVNYKNAVQSLYLRHLVVETSEMARLAVSQYLEDTASEDPFGAIVRAASACAVTREEAGKIGWIDMKDIESDRPVFTDIIPLDVIKQLISLAPKAGDVHIFTSPSTKQVHVVRVEELLLQHTSEISKDYSESRVGSHGGTNAVRARRKLKGTGLVPSTPTVEELEHKSYFIQTAGCQMNVADSERLAGIMERDLKLHPAPTAKTADVVMINTCSIRDHAEQKLYDTLGPICARKRNGESVALIVTGCVAQQEGEALLKRIPELDVVLGPQYVPFLRNVLESVSWGQQVVATAPMMHQEDDDFTKPVRGHDVRAWVNVIHGCLEHCTYCVVPAVRGMEQSRTMEQILRECRGLIVEQGYKEVTLLGQNIDAYGRDMVPKRTFAELLEYLNSNLPSGTRIRYVTSHPRYFSDRVIDAVANLDKVCECFHMPFQAGDNEVLRRMRRGYTYESYMRIIKKIREKAPDASICGDVICGFPGETEEQFQRTLDLMNEVKFDNLNTFAYSPRPNTEAALWHDEQIPEDVKNERLQRVQALANQHGLERSERYLGRVVEVLVEDRNPRSTAIPQVMGRTRQGRQVYFNGDLDTLRGELVQVRIAEARTWSLMGEIADSV